MAPRAKIRREIEAIPDKMLQKTMEIGRKRADLAVAYKGGHLPDIIFRVNRKNSKSPNKVCEQTIFQNIELFFIFIFPHTSV